jgi:dihydropteroate synthase
MNIAAMNNVLRPWRVSREFDLPLDRPRLIGILNVTPDSFSDGGRHPSVHDAVRAADRMIQHGAAVIDIGGESTRPGAASVNEDEQIRRTVPVITAIRREFDATIARISIDTTRAAVAQRALDAGGDIINDVSAGLDDPQMLPLAASRCCGLVLMHRRARPIDDQYSTEYASEPEYRGSVRRIVREFLAERVQAAFAAGVDRNAMVIDPGLGFGKSVWQNYELAADLGDLQRDLDLPALSAASRKSFLARPGNVETSIDNSTSSLPPPLSPERLAAGVALTLSHWQAGIRLFRVHDVAAHAAGLAAFIASSRPAELGIPPA